MNKMNKEDLWDECVLAFNAALQRAIDLYPDRWDRINQAKEQIREMIQKPGVTEEWIEEKANGMSGLILKFQRFDHETRLEYIKDFIRSLVEEIQGKEE